MFQPRLPGREAQATRRSAFILTGAVLGLLLACGTTTAPQPQPTTVTVSAKLPSIVALAETKPTQNKGGIGISVVPVQYELVKARYDTSARRVEPNLGEALLKPDKPAHVVETTRQTTLSVKPNRLAFQITVNNQLSRVFRAMGTVVQFNVCGKPQVVDASGYADLTNLIIPPRGEQQVQVLGPALAAAFSDKDQCALGFFLYDVPTKTDAAGNITEKQNFEWYFNYAAQLKEETVDAPQTRRRWVLER